MEGREKRRMRREGGWGGRKVEGEYGEGGRRGVREKGSKGDREGGREEKWEERRRDSSRER